MRHQAEVEAKKKAKEEARRMEEAVQRRALNEEMRKETATEAH